MAFEHFSPLHVGILGFTAGVLGALVYAARRPGKEKFAGRAAAWMAVVQIGNTIVYMTYRVKSGEWDLRYDLPMEFCNWSLFAALIALLAENRFMAEVAYYWIMAGSLQGLLTPDLQVTFPHTYFFVFFVNHSGLVIAALFLVFGMRLHPRRGSVLRAFLFLQLYVLCGLAIDFLFGANYGYLRVKPKAGSLMDLLPGWPYYLFWLEGVALALFTLLYLPFYAMNREDVKSNHRSPGTAVQGGLT